jgi:deoxycytidine triphosphate deaminase
MLFNATLAAQCVILSEYSKLTQAGVDLSAQKIEFINPKKSKVQILTDKTTINQEMYEEMMMVAFQTEDNKMNKGWHLSKGVYSVTFNEGINVPKNAQAKVTHRSSIYRIGNIIESPWWDAGFGCENMNTTLIVNTPMFVEKNARLAQVVFYEMPEPKELYSGQWQGLSSATHKG